MPSVAASLPAAEPRYDDPALRLITVARNATRPLESHEIAERISGFELPELLRYLQALRLTKACLESIQLLVGAKIAGVSSSHGLGDPDVDSLADMIEAMIHDSALAAEIERIETAIDIKEDR